MAKAKKTSNPIKARESLINTAKHLFARKGLSGTSIRDIANKANLNSSLISYYFNGKDGLYKECLKEIGETRLSFVEEILKTPSNKEEFHLRLRMLIENMFKLYTEDKDTGLLIIREYDRVNSPAEKIFKSTFLKVLDQIENFFKEAQKKKLISKDRDSFVLAYLFFGGLSSQMRLDHLRHRFHKRSLKSEEERKIVADHLIALFG